MTSPTPSVLEAFEGARHQSTSSTPRRVAVAAVGVFTIIALIALATHDRATGGEPGLDLAGGVITTPDALGGGGGGVGGGGAGPDGAGGRFSGNGFSGNSTRGDSAGGGGFGGDPSDPFSPPRPGSPLGSTDVAVVTGVLRTFAFGSQVGLPLLCNVAAGSVISGAPDPVVAEVVGAIASSCVEFGNQGNGALRALNEQLAALEAINPATTPVIEAIADTFNSAGSQSVPFSESLRSLGESLRFFAPED